MIIHSRIDLSLNFSLSECRHETLSIFCISIQSSLRLRLNWVLILKQLGRRPRHWRCKTRWWFSLLWIWMMIIHCIIVQEMRVLKVIIDMTRVIGWSIMMWMINLSCFVHIFTFRGFSLPFRSAWFPRRWRVLLKRVRLSLFVKRGDRIVPWNIVSIIWSIHGAELEHAHWFRSWGL